MEYNPVVNEKSFKEHIHSIVSNPLNAIVELIANAHDAGATELYIDWNVDFLNNKSSVIKFKDNGKGMSNEEFKNIWVELSYDRLKNSDGEYVEIENENGETIPRKVYGKHGKGRHAPFAFTNKYEVKTIKNGVCSIFEVSKDSKKGFGLSEKDKIQTEEKNGTCISFKITKIDNIPSVEEIKETIATRFLKDANFNIFLNNELIELSDISDENKTEFHCTYKDEEITIIKIKSNTTSRLMKFHGISWKFGNRIFSDNWDNILDGRLAQAKQYNFIISAEFLADSLNDTMTGFDEEANVDEVKERIYDCIRNSFKIDFQKEKNEKKEEIIKDNFNSIKKLGLIDKRDIVDFIDEVQDKCPKIKPEDLKATAEIFIKLKESHNSYKLLHKLAEISPKDYDSLYEILNEWNVQEAKTVLDEIKWRLDVVRELKLKVNDPNTDELHELQPLFEKGLWIFGSEYESVEFTSNQWLSTVVTDLLKQAKVKVTTPRLRPDLVVIPNDSVTSIYSKDKYDENGEAIDLEKILFVELKRGGFDITRKERNQVSEYIEQLVEAGHISENTIIQAYVLGSTVSTKETTVGKNITIIPKQYNIILNRAENRLFDLERKIREIKNISLKTGDAIFDDIMSQDSLDSY